MAHGGSPDEKRSASLEALNAKAKVLGARHNVPVAMVYPGDNGEQQYWPSREWVEKIYRRYRKLPEKDRREYSRSVTQNQAADLARELLRSIDASLAAVSDRIRELQPPPQDVGEVEQQLITPEQPGSFMVESQDHGSVGSDAHDMDRENAMPPNAVAPMEEESAAPGEDVVMTDQVPA
uniref:MADS-box domain-containing protein n=1 Tax=Oryza brachyantha TaxID=4533 RepID=J3L710_ORYBR